MGICSVAGCDKPHFSLSYCTKHYQRFRKTGTTDPPPRRIPSARTVNAKGYVVIRVDNKLRSEHTVIAERAFGKPLPPGVEVHHVDGNKTNNTNTNLVVCPDSPYHFLIEQRTRAFHACGHADWFKCWVCQRWDAPQNSYKGRPEHLECVYERRRIKA